MRVVLAASSDRHQEVGWAIRAIIAVAISITQQAAVAGTQQVRSVEAKTLGTRRGPICELLERVCAPVTVGIYQNANVPGPGDDRAPPRVDGQTEGIVSQFVVGHLRDFESLGHGQSQRFVGTNRGAQHDQQYGDDQQETQHGRLRRTWLDGHGWNDELPRIDSAANRAPAAERCPAGPVF